MVSPLHVDTRADPLVLVPGLMCDDAVWASLLPTLGEGRHCSVVDHGDARSLAAMAIRLLDVAPLRFALAGHSMGARVALEVVRLAPARVSRLALLDTGYLPRPAGQAGEDELHKRHALLQIARTRGVRAMAVEWVQGMVHPERLVDASLIEAIVAMFERKTAERFESQIAALLARPDASGVLASLSMPTLLLCGRQDGWAPPAQHQAMQALVTDAVLEVIEHAGHMPPMERPDAVAAALMRWLTR